MIARTPANGKRSDVATELLAKLAEVRQQARAEDVELASQALVESVLLVRERRAMWRVAFAAGVRTERRWALGRLIEQLLRTEQA